MKLRAAVAVFRQLWEFWSQLRLASSSGCSEEDVLEEQDVFL